MGTAVILMITFVLIILSVINNISIVYPMALSLLIVFIYAVIKGFRLRDTFNMALDGAKKSLIIYKLFILIGTIISVWMASGTVPALMYYGLKLIKPDSFILISFLLTSLIGMLLGTSFGTVSTIGVALMAVGRGFGVNTSILAGAIISGAYLGDRSSPMSSSAALTATVTESNIYDNLKTMIYTLIPSFIISSLLYYISGKRLSVISSDLTRVINIQRNLMNNFNITPFLLIPPILIMVFALFRVDIKINMLSGIAAGCILALFIQHIAPLKLLRYAVMGYYNNFSDIFLASIIKGGGIISMAKAACIIALSSAMNGIMEGTKMLDNILNRFTGNIKTRGELSIKSAIISIITAMYGCNQTISILMTGYIIKPIYKKLKLSNTDMAATIADTCVVLSPIVPWNIAGLVPAGNLGVRVIDYIPYAFLCLLLPVMNIVFSYFKQIKAQSCKISG